MSRQIRFILTVLAVLAVLGMAVVPPARAQAAPPSYQLQYLGTGTPTAINSHNVVAGRELITGTSNYRPLVSVNGSAWTALPVPAGAASVFPTDINDSGVIVGVAFTNWNPIAIRWTPNGNGYTLDEIPRISGDLSSYATGINNLGQIVGARRTLGYVPTGQGWLYDPQSGVVVDFATQLGWWSWPNEINDLGQVIGGAELLDTRTGSVTWIGNGPANYNAVSAVDINDSGMMVGAASLRSTSLNIVSVFRYVGTAGWQFIAGSSRYTTATSINNRGDIGYGELGAGLYLDGLGQFALGGLLAPEVLAAGWTITGSGALINDQRAVASVGRNSNSGQTGGVLLTAAGTLPPPSAPANLQGVPHPATISEPFNSINLTWENTSPLMQYFELERSLAGAGNWTEIELIPPGMNPAHMDTTVAVGAIYDYRVRAVGVGGPGPWSNVATVAAPTIPQDTTPPVVNILNPANGAAVSGTVSVSAQASDNVAVTYLEISFWNQYTGQQVILGSVENSGSLVVNWNTSGLTPAAYTLRAFAHDALGNWSQSEISVNVGATANSMRVSSITLSGRVVGSLAIITGDVNVRDSVGKAVSNASVSIRWTLPNQSIRSATVKTDSSGRARFSTSGPRGQYTLTVTGVVKSGFVFDAAGSVLTKSITR